MISLKISKTLGLKTATFAPASSKAFLDIQATIECGFSLKRVRDMTRTYSQLKLLGFSKNYITCYQDPHQLQYIKLLSDPTLIIGIFFMIKLIICPFIINWNLASIMPAWP